MSEFQVSGTNKAALFTLKIHRGDGMALIAMDWKTAKPPLDFVGLVSLSRRLIATGMTKTILGTRRRLQNGPTLGFLPSMHA